MFSYNLVVDQYGHVWEWNKWIPKTLQEACHSLFTQSKQTIVYYIQILWYLQYANLDCRDFSGLCEKLNVMPLNYVTFCRKVGLGNCQGANLAMDLTTGSHKLSDFKNQIFLKLYCFRYIYCSLTRTIWYIIWIFKPARI